MSTGLSDEQIEKVLQQSEMILKKLELSRAVKSLTKIRKELFKSQIDGEELDRELGILGTSSFAQFMEKDFHASKCVAFYKPRIDKAFSANLGGVKKAVNDRTLLRIVQDRAKARKVIDVIYRVFTKSNTTEEETFVGLCVFYMLVADGLFGKDLKFCYVYDKLANLEIINTQEIYRMKISKMQEYFKSIRYASFLFEGWDEDIRNAIAHSSFYYDPTKKKMIFEERKKNITKELTFGELRTLNTKLLNLDDLTILITQLSKIRDGILYMHV